MRHRILTLLLGLVGLVVLVSAGCGFHLRGVIQVPPELQTMLLESSDPYGSLTRFVRQQLRLSNINIVDDAMRKDIPTLRIMSSSDSQSTVSIFQDGTTAENQLVLRVQAQVLIPGQGIYPLHVTVFRSFFDNPLTALAKDAESDIIRQEMREQAAQQLVRQLLMVDMKKIKEDEKSNAIPANNAVAATISAK